MRERRCPQPAGRFAAAAMLRRSSSAPSAASPSSSRWSDLPRSWSAALGLGLWPLGRVHDVPVAALFREAVSSEWHRPRWRYLALMALVIALLVAVVIGLAYDKRVAAVFVASSVVVFALLRGIAAGLMALPPRLPRTPFPTPPRPISHIYPPRP